MSFSDSCVVTMNVMIGIMSEMSGVVSWMSDAADDDCR